MQLLPSQYTRGLITTRAIVGIIQKIKVQRVINILKENPSFHNPKFEHLKRDFEKLNKSELEELGIQSYETIDIPQFPPLTKQEYEEFREIWPVLFKNAGLDIQPLDSKEISIIENLMKKCYDLAQSSFQEGHRFNACLLIDPRTYEILCFAQDNCTSERDIDHCVMNLMQKFNKNKKVEEEVKTETNLQKRKSNIDLIDEKQVSQHKYYYCTDLDLVILREPCIMCAMALTHSRIRKVYYALKNSDDDGETDNPKLYGGLNKKLQINNLSNLNHKYLVYKGFLENELKDKISTVTKL